MGLRLLTLTLLFVSVVGFAGQVAADTTDVRGKELLSKASARSIADAKFKNITKSSVKRFSVQLIQDDEEEIVFAYEDLDVPPRPGSEIYITIIKKTRKVTWRHGK